MPFTLDHEIADGLAPFMEQLANAEPRQVGDWNTLRTNIDALYEQFGSLLPTIADVDTAHYTVRAHDGNELALFWFSKAGAQPGSGALYLHGGGMIGAVSAVMRPPFVATYPSRVSRFLRWNIGWHLNIDTRPRWTTVTQR